MVALINIDDGAAVGNDVSLEAPLAAKLILKKELARAGGLTVDAVEGAHHGAGFGLSHGRAESRKVSVELIMLADRHVGGVT